MAEIYGSMDDLYPPNPVDDLPPLESCTLTLVIQILFIWQYGKEWVFFHNFHSFTPIMPMSKSPSRQPNTGSGDLVRKLTSLWINNQSTNHKKQSRERCKLPSLICVCRFVDLYLHLSAARNVIVFFFFFFRFHSIKMIRWLYRLNRKFQLHLSAGDEINR